MRLLQITTEVLREQKKLRHVDRVWLDQNLVCVPVEAPSPSQTPPRSARVSIGHPRR